MRPNSEIPSFRRRMAPAPPAGRLLAFLFILSLVGGLAVSARAAEKPLRRIDVRPLVGAPLPYTIEVPEDWAVMQSKEVPGLFMGPPGAAPPSDPSLIYVRGSEVSLANPAAVAQSIRENDAKQPAWSAPRIEVKELGGVKGLLVRMDSGEGEKARSTLVLKLPLGDKGVDFLWAAPRAQFAKDLPRYEKLLLSIRPAAGSPAVKPK